MMTREKPDDDAHHPDDDGVGRTALRRRSGSPKLILSRFHIARLVVMKRVERKRVPNAAESGRSIPFSGKCAAGCKTSFAGCTEFEARPRDAKGSNSCRRGFCRVHRSKRPAGCDVGLEFIQRVACRAQASVLPGAQESKRRLRDVKAGSNSCRQVVCRAQDNCSAGCTGVKRRPRDVKAARIPCRHVFCRVQSKCCRLHRGRSGGLGMRRRGRIPCRQGVALPRERGVLRRLPSLIVQRFRPSEANPGRDAG